MKLRHLAADDLVSSGAHDELVTLLLNEEITPQEFLERIHWLLDSFEVARSQRSPEERQEQIGEIIRGAS